MKVQYSIPMGQDLQDYLWRWKILGPHISWAEITFIGTKTIKIFDLSEELAVIIKLKYPNVIATKERNDLG
jgi:hypothetical protein